MSNHNYSQYSNKKRSNGAAKVQPAQEETPIADIAPVDEVTTVHVEIPEVVKTVTETVDTVTLPETVNGVVFNCVRLNVRAKPGVDADVVCILDAKTEVKIDVAKSDNKWFYVHTTTGVEGYCMKQFVDARL